jgi:hypothetical protein
MVMKLLIKLWNYLIEWSEEINEHRRKYNIRGMY